MADKKKKKKLVKKSALKRRLKKKPARKTALKKKAKKSPPIKKRAKISRDKGILGIITHYFPHVQAAVIKLKAPLSVGDTIKIKGHTTDFTQRITSLQIDRVDINSAKPGQEIGILVNSRVRHNDIVTKL